jgi:hypothetical protein
MIVHINAYDTAGLVINPPYGVRTEICGIFLRALSSQAESVADPVQELRRGWSPTFEMDPVGYMIAGIIRAAESGSTDAVIERDEASVILSVFKAGDLGNANDNRIRDALEQGDPSLNRASDTLMINWFRDWLRHLTDNLQSVQAKLAGYIGVFVTKGEPDM